MTEERKPFWAKCPTCSHRWVVMYMPMPIEAAARLMKSAACPMCGQTAGTSSQAIAAHMSGGTVGRWGWGYPHDPDDLGRCLRLLELFPEWKPRIGEMAQHSPQWAALVARWDEIAASMIDEVGIAWEKGRSAPKTDDLMQAALKGAG